MSTGETIFLVAELAVCVLVVALVEWNKHRIERDFRKGLARIADKRRPQ